MKKIDIKKSYQYKISGIYLIISPSGKRYVGSSKSINTRIRNYITLRISQPIIKKSIIKYGVENHKFFILEECEEENLFERERYWGDYYNVIGPNGLNCALPGTKDKRYKISEETRKRFSLHFKRFLRKNHPSRKDVFDTLTGVYYESVVELCEIEKLNYGTMRDRLRGRYLNNTKFRYADGSGSDAFMKRIKTFKPREKMSEEVKKKMSDSRKGSGNNFFGKKHSKETIEKLRKINIGRKHTLETKMKMKRRNPSVVVSVLDTNTGLFFESISEAKRSLCIRISLSGLCLMIKGKIKNRSSLVKI